MSLSLSALYGLNLLVSLAAAVLFYFIVPKQWNPKPWPFLCAVFAFCFFIPILSVMSLLFVSLFLFFRGQPVAKSTILFVNKPSHFTHTPRGTQFGVGGVTQCLSTGSLSVHKRTEALLALSSLPNAENNALVRQSLSDNTDQIRLLAFSLLDQQEKQISAKITRLREQHLNSVPGPARIELDIGLAQAYWELIYKDLVQGDLKNAVLSLALQYAKNAWNAADPDPQLAILLSKLYLMDHDTLNAEKVLTIARERGVKATHVLPYLADISYQKRDFSKLSDYLKENPNLMDVPKLNQVMQFWRGEV